MKLFYKYKQRILFGILFCILACSWFLYKNELLNPKLIEFFRIEYPISSVFIFIILYAVFVIASLPSLPLNLAAGYFWGGLYGGIITTIGVTLGSWISFILARNIFGQPLSVQFDSKWASIILKEFDESGWKFVAFARINPIIPTGPLNYLLGLTSISILQFIIPTFIFLMPPSILFAFVGDTLKFVTAESSEVDDIIQQMLGLFASVSLLLFLKFGFKIYKKYK